MKRLFILLLTVCFIGQITLTFAKDNEIFDLNNATVEQLTSIPGSSITEDMARELIEMSQKKPFVLPEDLLKVPGLDNRTLEAINPVERNGSLWYDPENADMLLAPSKC